MCRTKEKNYLNEVINFVIDMVFNPLTENGGFLKDYTEREKINLIDYIEGIINDKKEYASLRCTEEMCKGDNYAVFEYGKKDIIENITPQELYKRYLDIMDNSRIDIFVMGNINADDIIDKVKQDKKVIR